MIGSDKCILLKFVLWFSELTKKISAEGGGGGGEQDTKIKVCKLSWNNFIYHGLIEIESHNEGIKDC